jgi:hypothetical protein
MEGDLCLSVAPHDQVALDGLHQGQGVDLHRTTFPLLQAVARRMSLELALEKKTTKQIK